MFEEIVVAAGAEYKGVSEIIRELVINWLKKKS
jgi:hypothetical protein